MKNFVLGIDIGGTKTAIVLGDSNFKEEPSKLIVDKLAFPTNSDRGYKAVINEILEKADEILKANEIKAKDLSSIGISCGGPLDSEKGIIYSPPNLPDWDAVEITRIFTYRFGVNTFLQNDANACALAEWRFGAGRGYRNMIFLTFGTGMGAGLILDGKLYTGANDMAGEVGHIRLAEEGPLGYGKEGSFEGFCSGGGIARLGKTLAKEELSKGNKPSFCKSIDELDNITAKSIAVSAKEGDATAQKIYEICGEYLGRGLAVLIDILNPQVIVIGSIFERSGELLEKAMYSALNKESLPLSLSASKILPAALGDSIGDFAALGVALSGI